MVARIERLKLREVWPHEALDFTRWLEQNVDVLSEVVGLNLDNAEREQSAGAFSVDLVAEDEDGDAVVIENQLERSNHDHLGKLVTYLTAVEAKTAIWIVSEPRPEHIRAIGWLNESSNASFYLLKVEAIRIDASQPAPLLTLIVGPSEEGRQAGAAKKQMAERYSIRHEFWTSLLERARERTRLHAGITPGSHGWIGTGAGKTGLSYNYVVTKHASTVELYIDRGQDAGRENEKVLEQLSAQREAIEAAFGDSLGWHPLEGRRACRVAFELPGGGYRDPKEDWPEVQDAMIDAMVRLEGALKVPISELQV